MTTITPNEEFVTKHWDKTVELLKQYNQEEVLKLLDEFSEEYAIAPASTDKDYHCAFPGGLCYHNLHVLQLLGRFSGAVGSDKFNKESLLKIAILHDIGKVGEKNKPYYLPTKEDWKIKKGVYFEVNSELQYMKIPQRSLYLAQQYGVPLTQDEYLAILLADGQLDETNSHYKYKEPDLATVLHYAVYWARKESKKHKVNWK